jgi:hypothetical protein
MRASLSVTSIAILALVACGGAGSATDAGAPCNYASECPTEPAHVCDDGQCVVLCDEAAGERACNLGASDFPPVCCGPERMCCEAGYERQDCFTTCPRVAICPRSSSPDAVCLDAYCFYEASPSPDAGPSAACVPLAHGGACVTACAPADRCGDVECCGPGTRCEDGCCVLDL